jgi:hypothetical protein
VGEPSVAPGDPKVEAGAGAIDDGVETAGVDAAGAGTEYGEDAGALLAAGGGADVPVAAEGTWARGVANCTRWAKAAGAATDHHTAARPQIIVAVFTHSPLQLGGEATRRLSPKRIPSIPRNRRGVKSGSGQAQGASAGFQEAGARFGPGILPGG